MSGCTTVSVLIPAYNCEATIEATLESVLRQTAQPDEILLMDDGSTDNTAAIVDSYRPNVTVFRQSNKGLSGARNGLLGKARSSLMAFLDADDVWHPRYIETQLWLFREYPNAVACFTGHTTFFEGHACEWNSTTVDQDSPIEVMSPLSFLIRYARAPGPFGMSWICVPKRVLNRMGGEPFKSRIAEDLYFCNSLALEGSDGCVVYDPQPLAGYRIRAGSLSSNRLVLNEGEVRAFEALEGRYRSASDKDLSRAFRTAFASKRRLFAKALMGVGKTEAARAQLRLALLNPVTPQSLAKSLALWCLSYAPSALQPTWSSSYRGCVSPGRGR